MKMHLLCAASAVSFAAIAANADLVITDPIMADANWSTVKVNDTTPNQDATGASAQQAGGGNPGAYRLTTHNWQITGSGVSITFAHLRSGAAWNPAGAGAISSVSVSYDAICFSAPLVNAVATNLVALQSGNYFYAVGSPFSGTALEGNGWVHFSGAFTQSDFQPMGGVGTIDFSAGGAPVQFGYYTANGGSGADFRNTATVGVDNFELHVVPAPASLVVLAGLAGLRRRR